MDLKAEQGYYEEKERKKKLSWFKYLTYLFNRPGVVRAVLQTHLSLIN